MAKSQCYVYGSYAKKFFQYVCKFVIKVGQRRGQKVAHSFLVASVTEVTTHSLLLKFKSVLNVSSIVEHGSTLQWSDLWQTFKVYLCEPETLFHFLIVILQEMLYRIPLRRCKCSNLMSNWNVFKFKRLWMAHTYNTVLYDAASFQSFHFHLKEFAKYILIAFI